MHKHLLYNILLYILINQLIYCMVVCSSINHSKMLYISWKKNNPIIVVIKHCDYYNRGLKIQYYIFFVAF